MASLSSNPVFTTTVGLAATLAAASAAPAQVTQEVLRDTRPLTPTGNAFRADQETYARPDSPLNGRFSVMRQRFTPEQSGGIATLSFDAVVVHGGVSVRDASAFSIGIFRNETFPIITNIWKEDQFNPTDLTSGLISSQSVPRAAPSPIRSGSDGVNRSVFLMTYEFNLPQISESTDYLVAFARASSDSRLRTLEVQLARPGAGLLISSAPDYTLISEFSSGPSGTFTPLEPILVNPIDPTSISVLPYTSSKLVITNVPEPASAVTLLACAAFTGLSRVRRK